MKNKYIQTIEMSLIIMFSFIFIISIIPSIKGQIWDGSEVYIIPNETSYSGTYGSSNPATYSFDGNWGTYSTCTGGTCIINRNYTKPFPLNNITTRLQVIDCSTCPGGASYFNISIPNTCIFNQIDKLMLRNYAVSGSISDKYQCYDGSTWLTIKDDGGAQLIWETELFSFGNIITLKPSGTTYSNTNINNINCSVQIYENAVIQNISLLTNESGTWQINETVTGSGTNDNNVFTKSYENNSNLFYACKVCDNRSVCGYSENSTLIIDQTKPSTTIISPNGTYDLLVQGDSMYLNWSVSDDISLNNCFYNYNGTNTPVSCGDGNTTFPLELKTNIIFYANDSAGNINSSSKNWGYKIFQNNLNYSESTLVGSLETITINITKNPSLSITQARLIYNGTSYLPTDTIINGNNYFYENNITIPTNTIGGTYNFYYSFVMSDSSIINTTVYSQDFGTFSVDNCDSYNRYLFNATLYDEDTLNIIPNSTNPVIEYFVNVYNSDKSIIVGSYYNITKNYNLSICISANNLNSSSYLVDSTFKYYADNYAREYYNIQSLLLNNDTSTQILNFYDLNQDNSTEFKLTAYGSDFAPIEDAIIIIQRQYIGENLFRTVEIPKTDKNGQTLAHLKRSSEIYNFIVIKEGEVITSYNNTVAFCSDYTINDCSIGLYSFEGSGEVFNYNNELGITYTNPYYNDNTGVVYFTYVTTDGTGKNVTMQVRRNNIFNNLTLCTTYAETPSATLNCNIGTNLTDSLIIIDVYVSGELIFTSFIDTDSSDYGDFGYFVWFIISLMFALLFGNTKQGLLFSVILGLVGGVGLGLSGGSLIGVGSGALWLILIVMIALWKLNQEKPQ